MEAAGIYQNLSPLDHRYRRSNPELFDRLSHYLSEEAAVRYGARVEAALLKAHLRRDGLLSSTRDSHVDRAADRLSPEAVYEEEERTHHNVRALVNVFRELVDDTAKPYVHLGATSVDILDTALAMRIRDVSTQVILPQLIELLERLVALAEREAETPQVGRTHGRHGVPITFGFAVAEYVARLGKSVDRIRELARDLRGKLAGAVGGYNALTLLVDDPTDFERSVLSELELAPAEYANQIVEPEYLLRLLLELNVAFGIMANLADDLRHLQRTELDEVREGFGSTQVGSSTMPQKRNPWNSEHVKSLWKAFSPRVGSFFADQISEHQRDLTNSASGRFIADFIAGFAHATSRMSRVLEGLYVNRERMRNNLDLTGDMILAEPLYVFLARTDHPNAHEELRRLTLESEQSGEPLAALLRRQPALWQALEAQIRDAGYEDADTFFRHPERYVGECVRKTRSICATYKTRIQNWKEDR
jgi:adenylosuccinate lyase